MLKTMKEASELIASGRPLFVAGQENLLAELPRGRWIGGTIPYFMDASGGETTEDKVFVTPLPEGATPRGIRWYDATSLPSLPADAPEPGFTMLIIPAGSEAHVSYAQGAPNYEGLFMKPIVGWISGVHLRDLGKVKAKAVNGETGELSDSRAIAMHVGIPAGKLASIGIINLFVPGNGPTIEFETEGFRAVDCILNGERRNLANYLTEHKIDTRLPLVGDYCGTRVNVSFQAVDTTGGAVDFYAPVFRGVSYRIAAPVSDYVSEFGRALPGNGFRPAFSCNCILNYLYSELEGKKTAGITGPITFGEIAYQLLNQTLVYLEIVG